MAPTLDAVTDALRRVEDPIFEKPLGVLGTLLDVRLEEGRAQVKVRVSSPSEELRHTLESRVQAALEPLGVGFVELDVEVSVPTREATSEDPLPDVRNVILVMSGKGGVGKSTVSTNLALALRRQGTRVGLLDADIYGPSLPTMLGIEGHPTSKDGKRIQPLQRFGIKLMSIGFLLEDPKQAVVWRGPMLHGALQQFVSDVDWGGLDYLIIDSPPGTGDVALTLAQKLRLTGAIIVTTPQEVALQDVYKSVSMCQEAQHPHPRRRREHELLHRHRGREARALRKRRRREDCRIRRGAVVRTGSHRRAGARVGRPGHAGRASGARLAGRLGVHRCRRRACRKRSRKSTSSAPAARARPKAKVPRDFASSAEL